MCCWPVVLPLHHACLVGRRRAARVSDAGVSRGWGLRPVAPRAGSHRRRAVRTWPARGLPAGRTGGAGARIAPRLSQNGRARAGEGQSRRTTPMRNHPCRWIQGGLHGSGRGTRPGRRQVTSRGWTAGARRNDRGPPRSLGGGPRRRDDRGSSSTRRQPPRARAAAGDQPGGLGPGRHDVSELRDQGDSPGEKFIVSNRRSGTSQTKTPRGRSTNLRRGDGPAPPAMGRDGARPPATRRRRT